MFTNHLTIPYQSSNRYQIQFQDASQTTHQANKYLKKRPHITIKSSKKVDTKIKSNIWTILTKIKTETEKGEETLFGITHHTAKT